jgi:poly-gamma-glutamate synthesis protein (capsule biosynthesis protein)
VNHATKADAVWLRDTLNREGRSFGTSVSMGTDNNLELVWNHNGN